jgi:hypothetical protein
MQDFGVSKKNWQHNILLYYVGHRVWQYPFLSCPNSQASFRFRITCPKSESIMIFSFNDYVF